MSYYCLLIDGKAICDADELDRVIMHAPQLSESALYELIISLKAYLLGGCLGSWLESHGGSHYLPKLKKLDYSADIERQVAEVFGLKAPEPKGFGEMKQPDNTVDMPLLSRSTSLDFGSAMPTSVNVALINGSYTNSYISSFNVCAVTSAGGSYKLISSGDTAVNGSFCASTSGFLCGNDGGYGLEALYKQR